MCWLPVLLHTRPVCNEDQFDFLDGTKADRDVHGTHIVKEEDRYDLKTAQDCIKHGKIPKWTNIETTVAENGSGFRFALFEENDSTNYGNHNVFGQLSNDKLPLSTKKTHGRSRTREEKKRVSRPSQQSSGTLASQLIGMCVNYYTYLWAIQNLSSKTRHWLAMLVWKPEGWTTCVFMGRRVLLCYSYTTADKR